MNHRRRKILQLMDLCQREFLHQVDLLSPSRTGVTEAEYWAQRRLNEKKQEIEKEGYSDVVVNAHQDARYNPMSDGVHERKEWIYWMIPCF